MKSRLTSSSYWMVFLVAGMLTDCMTTPSKMVEFVNPASPEVAANHPRRPNMDADRDIAKSIAHDLDTAFAGSRIHIRYAINDRTVTLTGNVGSRSKRARAESLASAVGNVQQVVNELSVTPGKRRFSN